MRLKKTQFIAWRSGKSASEVVGHNRDCHGCPLALFYAEASGGSEVVISTTDNGYRIDRGDGDRRLPLWADLFVRLVDREEDKRITAARALVLVGASP